MPARKMKQDNWAGRGLTGMRNHTWHRILYDSGLGETNFVHYSSWGVRGSRRFSGLKQTVTSPKIMGSTVDVRKGGPMTRRSGAEKTHKSSKEK